MKRLLSLALTAGVLTLLGAAPARAGKALSPEAIDRFDHAGYFTPNFKAAVHDLVDAKEALARAEADQKQYEQTLPALQQQATAAEARVATLRTELAKFDHPEESDFDALQARANDSAAKPDEVVALAQAYVWTYPTSPHLADAQQYLTLFQGRIAAGEQAIRDAAALKEAEHAKLIQRAKAHDLTLGEWRNLLAGLSQEELINLIGQPTSRQDTYWYYQPDWVVVSGTSQKASLQINFEAGRVLGVSAGSTDTP
jgi:DNA-binding transcriptional MerR regulator